MNNSTLSRRDFLHRGLAAPVAAALSGPALLHAAGGARRKPNVVLIVTDDQRLDHFGSIRKRALTPNLDRLAAEGMCFSRAYTSTSVCTPSRFSCLTGRYASRCSAPSFLRSCTQEGQTNVQWNTHLDHDPDQLFDIENDPGETRNLATDPKYATVLAQMKAELKRHLARMPGTFAEFKTDAK